MECGTGGARLTPRKALGAAVRAKLRKLHRAQLCMSRKTHLADEAATGPLDANCAPLPRRPRQGPPYPSQGHSVTQHAYVHKAPTDKQAKPAKQAAKPSQESKASCQAKSSQAKQPRSSKYIGQPEHTPQGETLAAPARPNNSAACTLFTLS